MGDIVRFEFFAGSYLSMIPCLSLIAVCTIFISHHPSSQCAAVLIEFGADVCACDENGSTAAAFALQAPHRHVDDAAYLS